MDSEDERIALATSEQVPNSLTASTPKIAPGFDGRSSWFSYEETVDDWLDITKLDAEKQGPSQKTRPHGDR